MVDRALVVDRAKAIDPIGLRTDEQPALAITDNTLGLYDILGKAVESSLQSHFGDTDDVRVECRDRLRFVTKEPKPMGA